jgi:uncharacterized protein (UPF0212 family)
MCVYNSFMFNFNILKKKSQYNWIVARTLLINILWDFNVYIIKNNNHAKKRKKQEWLYFMDKFELNS